MGDHPLPLLQQRFLTQSFDQLILHGVHHLPPAADGEWSDVAAFHDLRERTEHILPHSEVMKTILLEDSPCCCPTKAVAVHRREWYNAAWIGCTCCGSNNSNSTNSINNNISNNNNSMNSIIINNKRNRKRRRRQRTRKGSKNTRKGSESTMKGSKRTRKGSERTRKGSERTWFRVAASQDCSAAHQRAMTIASSLRRNGSSRHHSCRARCSLLHCTDQSRTRSLKAPRIFTESTATTDSMSCGDGTQMNLPGAAARPAVRPCTFDRADRSLPSPTGPPTQEQSSQ